MQDICPIADWRPLGNVAEEPNIGVPRILIFHTMVGYLRGTESYFKTGGYSGDESTFGIGGPWDGSLDGAIWQWQVCTRQADAQYDGNYYANSIETSDGGDPSRPWSPKQIDALVRLTAWWCRQTGHPCSLVGSPNDAGLGYHEQFYVWNKSGHTCPGAVREGQLRDVVIPAARRALAGNSPTPIIEEEAVLKKGDKGLSVQLYQNALLREAFIAKRPNPLPKFGADGDYGDETVQAVKNYQAAAQLQVTGQLDGVTAANLVRYTKMYPAS
jgi:peptidoglycan hydrolase-like protein with peptidoglycan-binding domain